MIVIDDRDSTTLFIQLYHKQIGSNKLFYKYDGIGLVNNKYSIVLNSNSKYLKRASK